jgi:hypothetical protein
MKVRTQDGLTIMPCEAINARRNERYQAWDIICFSPITGREKLIGSYSEEKQFKNVFGELQGWLDDRSRRNQTYYMPPDINAIQETNTSFANLNFG